MKTDNDGFTTFEDNDDWHDCIRAMYRNELIMMAHIRELQRRVGKLDGLGNDDERNEKGEETA